MAGKLKFVETQDGSVTCFCEEVGDYYHSQSGAREEAIEKHVKALGVDKAKNPVIFDMFFGLGYNSAAALDVCTPTIYCFENDEEILKKILEIDADFASFPHIKEFIRGYFQGKNEYSFSGGKLIMVFGDARETIKNINVQADFVFFDPFSPAKVPELWTASFFTDIKSKMKKNGLLSTYSYARKVRNTLSEVGFEVLDGPVIGRHSPSTISKNI